VQGDCLDAQSLDNVFTGITTAYYLIHSMGSAKDFEAQDRTAAQNFSEAARAANVKQIVYVGGLGARNDVLSKHLRSRHETGELLRRSGVPVIEFRSGIVIGSGSLSFELIRSLVERLPIMICPTWVRTPTQPIAVEDLIEYLLAVLELRPTESRVFEIGGADQVSYRDIILEYARQRNLKRWLISAPLLTPRLSSLWLGLTTPVYARVGRKLIESLRNPTVVEDNSSLSEFSIHPMGLRAAIERAIGHDDAAFGTTRWSDAVSASATTPSWGGTRFGTRLVDTRTVEVNAPPEAAFAPIRRIGGHAGWYHLDWMWRLRGAIDVIAGGVGMRRARRDPEELSVGEPLDWWRVEAYEPNVRLRLLAEMKLPGRAWLEFEVDRQESGNTTIRQTAVFDPAGLFGLLYWYGIYPLHAAIFGGMLRGIASRVKQPNHGPVTHG
jgi:uncharacterized protein YbjT (DUF2867 family)